jgi:pimeloyl-ACP methyl ester carboxylesterase
MHKACPWWALLAALAAANVNASAQVSPGNVPAPAVIPGQPYLSFSTMDSLGRTIVYYLSEPDGSESLPLVLYVQGSGARSHFVRRGDGQVAGGTGHSTVRDVFARAARVLIVDKPGTVYLDDPSGVEDASPAFHREHTLERWSEALRGAIRAACARDDVDCAAGLLVIGHSEGGVAAARVAATTPGVSHVAVLAGEGPPQLYSLLNLARSGEFFSRQGETAAARQAYVMEQWRQVLLEPDRADRFFFGHPFRRWSSFLSTSPADELRSINARVFIAQGTADRAVAPEAADMLFATLAARGRDACHSRIAGADHSFALPGTDGWKDVLTAVRDWFEGRTAESWLCSGIP